MAWSDRTSGGADQKMAEERSALDARAQRRDAAATLGRTRFCTLVATSIRQMRPDRFALYERRGCHVLRYNSQWRRDSPLSKAHRWSRIAC